VLSNEVPNAVGALISALKDPNSRDRFYAVRSLGTSADPRSLAPLLALFRTPTWNFVTLWPILPTPVVTFQSYLRRWIIPKWSEH
jgi:hypothetical protein